MKNPPLELVVAHYRENLNWLRNVPDAAKVTVYDKCPKSAYPNGTALENIGREAHTYLYHIIDRYDSLAEWTVFCQGKPFDHAYNFHQCLRDFVTSPENIGSFVWLGHLIDTDDNQGERLFKGWSKNEDGRGLDLAGFHKVLFGHDGPAEYTFVLGAQFVVHHTIIRQQPLNFYRHALEVSINFPDAAHCYERTWDKVFGLQGIDSVWLDGRKTVLLKPMKNQTA